MEKFKKFNSAIEQEEIIDRPTLEEYAQLMDKTAKISRENQQKATQSASKVILI